MENNKEENCETNESYDCHESSSNPNLTNNMDIDPSEKEKIKGDAIGDTMYSERFVLKTMLLLVEDNWTEEKENDLCTLWDMTTEKDVVHFLLKNDFIKLSISVIKKTEEIRLTEIMVGIVGNMCCFPEACKEVYNSDYKIYLSLIEVGDTPLLIQLMRLFKGLFFGDDEHLNLLVNEMLIEQINFILSSSQNSELLIYTLQVLAIIIDKKKSDILTDIDIMCSVNEAFKQLFKNVSEDIDTTGFLSHEHEKIITAYLKVLQNISLSVEEEISDEKRSKISLLLQNNLDDTLTYLETILSLCCDVDMFHSLPKNIEFYIFSTTQFITLLKVPFCLKILELLINIFDIILTENINVDKEVISELIVVICDMINKGDLEVLRKLFKTWPIEKIVFLLKDNIMEKNKCDDDFIKKFNNLCSMLE